MPTCLTGILQMPTTAVMLQVYLQRMPELAGKTFGELVFHLPQATAYGLVQSRSRRCLLNPPAETLIDKRDEIVMIRSTDLSKADMQPLAEPTFVDMGAFAGIASDCPAASVHRSLYLAVSCNGRLRGHRCCLPCMLGMIATG